MKLLTKFLILTALAMSLTACTSAKIADYEGESPELKLEEFFQGDLVGYGTVQTRSGKVSRRFKVDIIGTWEGNEGELDETFYWSDGTEQKRIWKLTKTGENTYEGTAGDVEGVAVGTTAGYALHWVYKLEVEVDGRELSLTLDDWMYQLDEDRLMNRSKMTYFGFHVGDITLYIERVDG
jgi:hypothetical protein